MLIKCGIRLLLHVYQVQFKNEFPLIVCLTIVSLTLAAKFDGDAGKRKDDERDRVFVSPK